MTQQPTTALRRLLPQQTLGPLRQTANGLILLVAAAPPLILLIYCFAEIPEIGIILFGGGLATGLLSSLIMYGVRVRTRSAQARVHQEALAALLAAHQLTAEDRSPQAEALRAEFWRARQREAIEDLQRRASQLPPTSDLIDSLRHSAYSRGKLIASCCLAGMSIALLIAGLQTGPLEPIAFVCCAGWSTTFGLYLLTAHSWSALLAAREQRRELDREVRRVEDLAALAGGLSLADDEIEAIWRGALSVGVAQGGELELDGEPPQETQEASHRRAQGGDDDHGGAS